MTCYRYLPRHAISFKKHYVDIRQRTINYVYAHDNDLNSNVIISSISVCLHVRVTFILDFANCRICTSDKIFCNVRANCFERSFLCFEMYVCIIKLTKIWKNNHQHIGYRMFQKIEPQQCFVIISITTGNGVTEDWLHVTLTVTTSLRRMTGRRTHRILIHLTVTCGVPCWKPNASWGKSNDRGLRNTLQKMWNRISQKSVARTF